MTLYALTAYAAFGALYGLHLARKYSHSAADFLLIVAANSAAWPLFLYVEKSN